MNYRRDSLNSPKDETLRQLVLAYVNASNNKDEALAEKLLAEIRQIKRLCND